MASVTVNMVRVSTALTGDQLLRNIQKTNVSLLKLQEQISTNKKVNRPSDAPESISRIGSLNWLLMRFTQRTTDLSNASNISNVTDQALSDASAQLQQAKSIASSQIGVTATAETRAAQATVVSGLLDGLMQIANRDFDNIHLFGGEKAATTPFATALGGIQYSGSTHNLQVDATGPAPLEANSNGLEAFGALSNRLKGTVDLDPNATSTTRLADINGARGIGFTPGKVQVTVDGTSVNVDLTTADTLGDVVTRINAAINNIDPTAGSIAVAPDGFALTANAAHTLSIAEVGGGVTASDLGIAISATAATVNGYDIDPKLTLTTSLSQLGASVNLAGGLKITNGPTTRTINTAALNTVEDLLNAVNNAGVGVRLELNDTRTGFNLYNEVSGASLSVGENGGTTATDLGIRSFQGATLLSEFNNGAGVRQIAGQPDFRINLLDGTYVDVNIDGNNTVQDVINTINTAGAGKVAASLATTGNGIVLSDLTGGSTATFNVTPLNGSFAAQDLGIYKNAGATATISGSDTAQVQADSVFSHLIQLRDALNQNDERGITLAGEAIDRDLARISSARAAVGVRANRIESEKTQIASQTTQTKSMLSDLQDTDITEAISRFTQMQQQLQANLQTAGKLLQMSLLDFLR
jgi:flagellar hook-associated protein 3 FlgL